VIPAGQCWALLIAMPTGYSERARGRLRLDAGPLLTGLSVMPSTPSIPVGGTLQLTVAPIDQSGNPITTVVAWVSTNTAVATVSSSGVVTAVAPGTATIIATATASGVAISASAAVIVP
jgi:uncharacterized protein YjdB